MPNSRFRTILIGVTCTAALGVLGGCGSASSASGAATSRGIGDGLLDDVVDGFRERLVVRVVVFRRVAARLCLSTISKFAYQTPASVGPGATVTVMNMDGEAHTLTADKRRRVRPHEDRPLGASSTFTAPYEARQL